MDFLASFPEKLYFCGKNMFCGMNGIEEREEAEIAKFTPWKIYHAPNTSGYNNPSHEHQSLLSMLISLKLPHFDNKITPFDVNHK